MPGQHALLSASKAKQWLACPPSARLNQKLSERLGDRATPYAEEGTKAHAVAELKLRHEVGEINDFLYKEERKQLGEIDAAATAVDGVDYACCLFDAVHDKLVLVYTGAASSEDVRAELSVRLQEYMIPAELHQRATMLFNLNGKIDRKALTEEYCGGEKHG
jgi:hypothetical protein